MPRETDVACQTLVLPAAQHIPVGDAVLRNRMHQVQGFSPPDRQEPSRGLPRFGRAPRTEIAAEEGGVVGPHFTGDTGDEESAIPAAVDVAPAGLEKTAQQLFRQARVTLFERVRVAEADHRQALIAARDRSCRQFVPRLCRGQPTGQRQCAGPLEKFPSLCHRIRLVYRPAGPPTRV